MASVIGFTLAVVKMDDMLDFYSRVFKISFNRIQRFNTKMYQGNWDSLELLFCPAHLANNKAEQNRHQFNVIVDDIQKSINLVTANNGILIGEISKDESFLSIGCYDPDKNSIVLKQYA
ncbi:MAG: hypothetical protein AAF348_12865 [Bacteroidota bacterium]